MFPTNLLKGLLLLAIAIAIMAACGGGGGATTAGPTPASSPLVTERQPGTLTTAELVNRLRPSVVHIQTETATINVFGQAVPSRGVGTGIIIDEKGHILTNNHVVVQPSTCDQPARQITVTLSDGRSFPARIVGQDVPTDLAVLQIEAADLFPAILGNSTALQVGDEVVAIGNALNLPGGPTVTKGVVSAKDRDIDEDQCSVTIPGAIQTDAAINPGNSGGPLVNAHGEVIGITTSIIPGAEGLGFAISIDTAKPIAQELVAQGRVERAFLGLRGLIRVTPALADSFKLPVKQGIMFQGLVSNGPAERAGLRSGDIIIRLAGQDVKNVGDLFQALADHRPGEQVTLEFYRGNDMKRTDVTLG